MTCSCETCRDGLRNSLDALERMVTQGSDFDRRMELLAPLVRLLMPKTKAYAKAGRELGGFSIHLLVEDWPEQYEFGIDRVLGVGITWFKRDALEPMC